MKKKSKGKGKSKGTKSKSSGAVEHLAEDAAEKPLPQIRPLPGLEDAVHAEPCDTTDLLQIELDTFLSRIAHRLVVSRQVLEAQLPMIKSIALEILRGKEASKSSSPNESSIKTNLHTIASDQALIFAGSASSRKNIS